MKMSDEIKKCKKPAGEAGLKEVRPSLVLGRRSFLA
ncbi:hypothetical protein LCGC14_3053780, partial [marine sediment metagenome]